MPRWSRAWRRVSRWCCWAWRRRRPRAPTRRPRRARKPPAAARSGLRAAAARGEGADMLIFETFTVALEALRANKLRSFLTMLGIVIGVSAVIAMVALGRGAQRSVKERIAQLGTTVLRVVPGQQRMSGSIASATERARLTLEDAQALEDRGQVLAAVQPEMQRTMQVVYGSHNTNTDVVGTTANYLEVRRYAIAYGRMFYSSEDAAARMVAVLGPQVVDDLGITTPELILGEDIR